MNRRGPHHHLIPMARIGPLTHARIDTVLTEIALALRDEPFLLPPAWTVDARRVMAYTPGDLVAIALALRWMAPQLHVEVSEDRLRATTHEQLTATVNMEEPTRVLVGPCSPPVAFEASGQLATNIASSVTTSLSTARDLGLQPRRMPPAR